MKHHILCLLSIATPTVGLAQSFGDVAGCAVASGATVQTDTLFLWDGDFVHRMEARCPVTFTHRIGGGAFLLDLTCEGEGESWNVSYLLEPTADSDGYLATPAGGEGPWTELRLCE
ncbi:hypothetical protein [Yoonia sp. BS5-3]|uniref:Uncharacterized protein n=1 Tax=Yoonia phaeophyticola TaxID=3137369 RepID=A0ABZ2V4H3_9RHOB